MPMTESPSHFSGRDLDTEDLVRPKGSTTRIAKTVRTEPGEALKRVFVRALARGARRRLREA